MYSPYILRYRYCRHVTLDVFWLKGEKAFRNVETLFSVRAPPGCGRPLL